MVSQETDSVDSVTHGATTIAGTTVIADGGDENNIAMEPSLTAVTDSSAQNFSATSTATEADTLARLKETGSGGRSRSGSRERTPVDSRERTSVGSRDRSRSPQRSSGVHSSDSEGSSSSITRRKRETAGEKPGFYKQFFQ
ncbi:hypothetical protein [Parendozoicomonas sp. Alg238-R29]|uniref:hypothetical protein n=1 Tax=Parendozoicomonas sp. Alg238-R29 TaxID=2993446 RepID=UPI00248D5834|nr:hypothetical protein [Parendozoicomonas sp. Alg238-R29]